MIAKLVNYLLQTLLTILQNFLAIITVPIDRLIDSAFPNLAEAINQALSFILNVFGSISWAIGLLPISLKTILALIFTFELAKYSYFIGIKVITYSYNLIQKVKFW